MKRILLLACCLLSLNGCAVALIGLAANAVGAKGGSAAYQQANPSLAPNGQGATPAH